MSAGFTDELGWCALMHRKQNASVEQRETSARIFQGADRESSRPARILPASKLHADGGANLRIETNLRYWLKTYLSLNLTVINLYDTRVAQGVEPNDLQIRSSIGVKF